MPLRPVNVKLDGFLLTYLHLSVPVLVWVTTPLALPAELLQLRLAALDGF